MDEYDRVGRALTAVGAETGAAEAQGLLCGMLSAPGKAGKAEWIAQVLENTHPAGEAAKECLAALVQLYDRSLKQMDTLDMELQLLLPDDEVDLKARARALGEWCQGFLAGVGLGGLTRDTPMPAEVAEALRDLGAISQVELEAAEGEDNEEAYAELVEYVRIAAMLVRTTLRGEASGKPQGKTLH